MFRVHLECPPVHMLSATDHTHSTPYFPRHSSAAVPLDAWWCLLMRFHREAVHGNSRRWCDVIRGHWAVPGLPLGWPHLVLSISQKFPLDSLQLSFPYSDQAPWPWSESCIPEGQKIVYPDPRPLVFRLWRIIQDEFILTMHLAVPLANRIPDRNTHFIFQIPTIFPRK